MHYRKLGKTEAEISEVGFGAWGIGGKQWLGGKDDESERALRRAFELGVNFVDTALAYGDGHSERLVGEAVKSSFRRIYVATKVPPKNHILAGLSFYTDCRSVPLRLHHRVDKPEPGESWSGTDLSAAAAYVDRRLG